MDPLRGVKKCKCSNKKATRRVQKVSTEGKIKKIQKYQRKGKKHLEHSKKTGEPVSSTTAILTVAPALMAIDSMCAHSLAEGSASHERDVTKMNSGLERRHPLWHARAALHSASIGRPRNLHLIGPFSIDSLALSIPIAGCCSWSTSAPAQLLPIFGAHNPSNRGLLRAKVIVVPVANPIGLGQVLQASHLGRFHLATGQNFNRGFADLARDVDVAEHVAQGGGAAAVTTRVRSAFAAYVRSPLIFALIFPSSSRPACAGTALQLPPPPAANSTA